MKTAYPLSDREAAILRWGGAVVATLAGVVLLVLLAIGLGG